MQTMTPMLRQYFELKDKCPDAILFFRMGDFYEVFGDDALKVAPILNIMLTNRNREEKMPFCGVPHHSYRPYCQKLLANGFKVAVAEQMHGSQAAGKGIIRREIVDILSPGLQDDVDILTSDKPNYLACLYEDPASHRWALLLAEVSTGELRCGEFDALAPLLAFLKSNEPTELLLRAFQHEMLRARWGQQDVPLISAFPEESVGGDYEQQVREVFPPQAISTLTTVAQKKCLAGFVSYMQKSFRSLACFLAVRPLASEREMTLAANVVRDLEIFATTQHSSQGSLYRLLNQTCTAMGARRLRYCLLHPLLDAEMLAQRKQRVASLVQQGIEAITRCREQLKGCIDLERIGNLILSRRIQPSQVSAIAVALDKALMVGAEVDAAQVQRLSSLIQQTFRPEAGQLGAELEVFLASCDEELAQAVQLATQGEEQVKAYEQQLRKETGISSLRIKRHKSLGMLVEITKANLAKVPDTFTLAQTTVSVLRYRTAALQQLEQKLAMAMSQAISREEQLYQEFLAKLQGYHRLIMRVSAALAAVDLCQSYAYTAIKENYCQVEVADCVELYANRHPVIEKISDEFVANDIVMGGEENKIILLTGANMAGKSTTMRQVALAALMHQAGMHVPARRARLPIFDQVFTRVGASDNISAGQSTFMVEMSETAMILRLATRDSLVIVDEVGRGTSTADGLALAQAIFSNLVSMGCFCFFATHFHELLPAISQQTKVRAMQIEVQDGSIFTHRLVAGAASKSFGIEVARQAGIPPLVIQQAEEMLCRPAGQLVPAVQASDERDKALEKLRDLRQRLLRVDVSHTTPLQALNLLDDLQSELL
ncbi:MAG: DNA mismatch repair protein MutS [Pseudomonadota bacterium]|nr:DNA mismatch repair protein MutS [Pseudomonadota bacterium]